MVIKSLKLTTRPKYIFNKCGTNIYFFTLQRFGPSPSPNFKQNNTFIIRYSNSEHLRFQSFHFAIIS